MQDKDAKRPADSAEIMDGPLVGRDGCPIEEHISLPLFLSPSLSLSPSHSVYMYIYTYIYMCVCIYIYIYMYSLGRLFVDKRKCIIDHIS